MATLVVQLRPPGGAICAAHRADSYTAAHNLYGQVLQFFDALGFSAFHLPHEYNRNHFPWPSKSVRALKISPLPHRLTTTLVAVIFLTVFLYCHQVCSYISQIFYSLGSFIFMPFCYLPLGLPFLHHRESFCLQKHHCRVPTNSSSAFVLLSWTPNSLNLE